MLTRIEMEYMEAVKKIAREMSKYKEIDWEQRRYEISKDVMVSFMANSNDRVFAEKPERQAEDAVKYADALIAALKSKSPKSE